MVANLTRYSACKVHADTPHKPVRERTPAEQPAPPAKVAATGDEPVRLFAWVSA